MTTTSTLFEDDGSAAGPDVSPVTTPASIDPPELVGTVPQRRFCTRCGVPWQAVWIDACGECVSRASLAAVALPVTDPSPGGEIRSALSLYFALLAVSIVGMIAIFAKADVVWTEFAMLGAQAVVVVGWSARDRRAIAPALIRPARAWWYPLAVGLGGCTYLVATAAVNGLQMLAHVKPIEYSRPVLDAGFGWTAVIVSVAVMPAVFEELAFRGVILGALRRVLTDGEAMVVTALMFMVLHLAVPSFPHLLLLGLILAFLRVRSGSLVPGILLHFTHNLLCVAGERFHWF